LQKKIMEQLHLVNYATNLQLAKLCNSYPSNISNAIKALLNVGYIDGSLLTRPMILHLTATGARYLKKPLPAGRRHASWSDMAHACHLNEIREILFLEQKGFRFLIRQDLLKHGLNSAHGEHLGIDGAGKNWLVLLDDYGMASDRIKRSWVRKHTPVLKYWPDYTGRTWKDVVQRFLVVTTDKDQANRHLEYILENKLPADVKIIKPLWKI
jgi:hypothetical protein